MNKIQQRRLENELFRQKLIQKFRNQCLPERVEPEPRISEKVEPKRQVYTVAEVAEALGICTKTVEHAVKRGEIPAKKLGRRILIPKVAFDKWLLSENKGNAPK